MRYLIIIEESNTGFSAYSPDLPGCVSTGASRTEVQDNMRDAITAHLEALREDGVPAPKPSATATYVDVAA